MDKQKVVCMCTCTNTSTHKMELFSYKSTEVAYRRNFENVLVSRRNHSDCTVWFLLCQMSKIGKSLGDKNWLVNN